MINFDAGQELQSTLSPGEKLLWADRPKGGIVLHGYDVFAIPFSLMWGGFAIFWESTVLRTQGPIFMKLWGIPFVLVGLYMIIGRFFFDAKKRSNTVYGLTEDRIIIKSGIFRKTIKSLNIRTLSDISFNQKKDNSGTITLGPSNFNTSYLRNVDILGNRSAIPQLEMIEDVKTVYDKIIALQQSKYV